MGTGNGGLGIAGATSSDEIALLGVAALAGALSLSDEMGVGTDVSIAAVARVVVVPVGTRSAASGTARFKRDLRWRTSKRELRRTGLGEMGGVGVVLKDEARS